jgi:transposase-like protein
MNWQEEIMSVQRRKYDSDFKRNAVQLTEESDRSVKEVAENLGINKDLLYRWRREQHSRREGAFPGRGKEALTDQEKRIRDLEKKLKDAEMERDILKKAMAIFSRAPK